MRLHAIGPGIFFLLVVSGLVGNFNSTEGMSQTPASSLPLHTVATIRLPGGSSRFDYQSLDEGRHLLFIAHLGAGMIHVVDTRANTVVATIHGIAGVHGVLVLPQLRRVYASATDSQQVAVTLALGLGTEPAEPAKRIVTAAAIAGLVTITLDLFV